MTQALELIGKALFWLLTWGLLALGSLMAIMIFGVLNELRKGGKDGDR